MAERIAVLTIRTMTHEIADALRRSNPEAEVKPYDLEGIRRDRRRLIVAGRGRYTGVAKETMDEAFAREMRKIANRYPWTRPYRWAVERAVRQMIASTYAVMEPFLDDCDAVVLWNGLRGPRFAAASIARARGLRTAFFERGFLPNTVQVDAQGVNYGSDLARSAAARLADVEITPEREAWLEGLAFEQRPLGNMKRPVARTVRGVEEVALPGRFLLLLAQVHDDTQLDFYSPHFRTMEEAIRVVHAELQAYNAACRDDLKLVVKEHPQDYKRADYDALRRELGDATFLQNVDNDELLRLSAGVVTINSSMGLQAIARDRPVATLGDSVYSVPGVVHRVPEDGPLRDLIPSMIAGEGLDRDRQRRLLVYLHERCLVDLPAYKATKAQYDGVADKIWQTLHAQRA